MVKKQYYYNLNLNQNFHQFHYSQWLYPDQAKYCRNGSGADFDFRFYELACLSGVLGRLRIMRSRK